MTGSDYLGHRTRAQVIELCRAEGVQIVSGGAQVMKLYGGGATVWYDLRSGDFWGQCPNGERFSTVRHGDDPAWYGRDWFVALKEFFWLRAHPHTTQFSPALESIVRGYWRDIDDGLSPERARQDAVTTGRNAGYPTSEIERALDLRIAERKGQQPLPWS